MKKHLLLFSLCIFLLLFGKTPVQGNEIADYYWESTKSICEEEEEISKAQITDIVKRAYPNPASKLITIDFNQGELMNNAIAHITIMNLVGKKVDVRHQVVIDNSIMLKNLKLEDGVYFLQVRCGKKYETLKVFISNH